MLGVGFLCLMEFSCRHGVRRLQPNGFAVIRRGRNLADVAVGSESCPPVASFAGAE